MFDLYNTKKFEKYKHVSKKLQQEKVGSPFQQERFQQSLSGGTYLEEKLSQELALERQKNAELLDMLQRMEIKKNQYKDLYEKQRFIRKQ